MEAPLPPFPLLGGNSTSPHLVARQLETIGMDAYPDTVDDRVIRKLSMARDIDRAMNRTRRLLESRAAAENPHLREKWEKKLQRQMQNLIGVC